MRADNSSTSDPKSSFAIDFASNQLGAGLFARTEGAVCVDDAVLLINKHNLSVVLWKSRYIKKRCF